MLNREMVQQQREGKSRTTELRIVASGKDKSVAGITFIHVQLETKIELFFLLCHPTRRSDRRKTTIAQCTVPADSCNGFNDCKTSETF